MAPFLALTEEEVTPRSLKKGKLESNDSGHDVALEHGLHTPRTLNEAHVEPQTEDNTLPGFPRTPASLSPTQEPGYEATSNARIFSHVQIPRPSLTESAFTGWEAPASITPEAHAIEHLSKSITPGAEDGHLYIDLDDFTIYRPPTSNRGLEMCTLDRIRAGKGVDDLQFSGVVSGETEIFLHGIQFSTVAIDGYDDTECISLQNRICIQSPAAESAGLWYRLQSPSKEYKGFHEPFMWLALFTKYFLEYLLEHDSVTLHSFRSGFSSWLSRQYGHTQGYQDWIRQCGFASDFGTSVAAFVNYLYKECYSIDDGNTRLLRQPIWKEIDPRDLDAIKREPSHGSSATVVTPFAHRCFADMYFASHLEAVEPRLEVLDQITERKHDLSLTPWNTTSTGKPDIEYGARQLIEVAQGDFVCTESNPDSGWKNSKAEVWFAYIQSIHEDRKGNKKLDVLWLYEPADTTLGNAHYPFENELFLSDNCSCGKDAIPIEAVIDKVEVSWFINDPTATHNYFVRQKFQTSQEEDSYSFVTLRSQDFSCSEHHRTQDEIFWKEYHVGDTVLALPERNGLLQPMQIQRMDAASKRVYLRTFLRSSTVDAKAPPNELESHASDEVVLRASDIARHCKIGAFASRTQVPLPYNRDGVGDHFYTLDHSTNRLQSTKKQHLPSAGGKPLSETALPGLDLFCGGGNFGRGLEEAGIAKMKYAVDWDAAALHSYRANVEQPEKMQYFLGSVNDALRLVLADRGKINVARVGNIDLIAAGSPCPGFSAMQPNKQSEQSLQFASMVASVVSFVDTYSPQYFVLENVVPMTHKIIVNGQGQNVFSQIVASLAALGYQVQQYLKDAWSQSSPSQRSRVFIVASAPGMEPLKCPPQTHAHPPGKEVRRTLGKTTSGLPFGVRKYVLTPFPYVSARQATADLPDIGDSLPQICPQFPDHRTHANQSIITRQRLARVPLHPYGMGLAKAVHAGRITSGEAYNWVQNCKGLGGKTGSRAYSRIRPDGLFPTILTKLHLQCGINGNVLHWEQHRSLSIMETRRTQGVLDHEVIIGSPSQQLQNVGNSVDRKVALALGLAMKDSWDATIKARRSILHGDDGDAMDEGITEEVRDPYGTEDGAPDAKSLKRESAQAEVKERSMDFKDILRSLRAERSMGNAKAVEWALMDAHSGSRWSGDSPSDSLKVRRRLSELEAAFYEP